MPLLIESTTTSEGTLPNSDDSVSKTMLPRAVRYLFGPSRLK